MKLRNVLKAAALAAVAAAPASGQAAPGGATKPDFSGILAHPWLPGFEALSSGPTALVNLSRRPDGVQIQTRLVRDYKNPLLTTAAAGDLKKPHPHARPRRNGAENGRAVQRAFRLSQSAKPVLAERHSLHA